MIAELPLTERIKIYEDEARYYLEDGIATIDIMPTLGTLSRAYCANPAAYSQPTYQAYSCPQDQGQCGCCYTTFR